MGRKKRTGQEFTTLQVYNLMTEAHDASGSKFETGPNRTVCDPGNKVVLAFISKYMEDALSRMQWRYASEQLPRLVCEYFRTLREEREQTPASPNNEGPSNSIHVIEGHIELDNFAPHVSAKHADPTNEELLNAELEHCFHAVVIMHRLANSTEANQIRVDVDEITTTSNSPGTNMGASSKPVQIPSNDRDEDDTIQSHQILGRASDPVTTVSPNSPRNSQRTTQPEQSLVRVSVSAPTMHDPVTIVSQNRPCNSPRTAIPDQSRIHVSVSAPTVNENEFDTVEGRVNNAIEKAHANLTHKFETGQNRIFFDKANKPILQRIFKFCQSNLNEEDWKFAKKHWFHLVAKFFSNLQETTRTHTATVTATVSVTALNTLPETVSITDPEVVPELITRTDPQVFPELVTAPEIVPEMPTPIAVAPDTEPEPQSVRSSGSESTIGIRRRNRPTVIASDSDRDSSGNDSNSDDESGAESGNGGSESSDTANTDTDTDTESENGDCIPKMRKRIQSSIRNVHRLLDISKQWNTEPGRCYNDPRNQSVTTYLWKETKKRLDKDDRAYAKDHWADFMKNYFRNVREYRSRDPSYMKLLRHVGRKKRKLADRTKTAESLGGHDELRQYLILDVMSSDESDCPPPATKLTTRHHFWVGPSIRDYWQELDRITAQKANKYSSSKRKPRTEAELSLSPPPRKVRKKWSRKLKVDGVIG